MSIVDLALATDGTLLASASKSGRLDVWDTESRDRVASFIADGALTAVAVSPDGTRIAAGDSLGRVHLLHLERGAGARRSIRPLPSRVHPPH
jgi:WD40 repeat protein